jgi:predicted transcriptional regulator
MVSTRLEVEGAKALDELAWNERRSRSQIVDEIIVAYLKDRFPDRRIVTMEDARYGDRDEPRHFEHDELGWRRGARTAVG